MNVHKKIFLIVTLLASHSVGGFSKPIIEERLTKPTIILGLYQLMKDIHELFGAYNIPYCIEGGTLIGALRHKGIIPWDVDLDIWVHQDYIEAFLALEPLFSKLGYEISYDPQMGYLVKGKVGSDDIVCDIFPIKKRKNRYEYARRGTVRWYHRRDRKADWPNEQELFPYTLYKFGTFYVYGPHDPWRFLDELYENWRTTARFLTQQKYVSETVLLTDEDTAPALPLGPLEDRVAPLLKSHKEKP